MHILTEILSVAFTERCNKIVESTTGTDLVLGLILPNLLSLPLVVGIFPLLSFLLNVDNSLSLSRMPSTRVA